MCTIVMRSASADKTLLDRQKSLGLASDATCTAQCPAHGCIPVQWSRRRAVIVMFMTFDSRLHVSSKYLALKKPVQINSDEHFRPISKLFGGKYMLCIGVVEGLSINSR
jgi:hypothetical protein